MGRKGARRVSVAVFFFFSGSEFPPRYALVLFKAQLREPFLEILIFFLHFSIFSAKPALKHPKPALNQAKPALERPNRHSKKKNPRR